MKTSTKLMLIAMLAFAAGGTCPSDVNNDGNVGIQDFLQVLGAWGPCPNASIVDVVTVRPFVDPKVGIVFVRLWSDGFAEYRTTNGNLGHLPNVKVWTALPVRPDPPDANAVAISGAYLRHFTTTPPDWRSRFHRLWSDGTIDTITYDICDGNPPTDGWSGWATVN